jgi:hypothetical protein
MNNIIIPVSKIDLAIDAGSCVYTLYNNGIAVYVGQSINLTARLASHKSFKNFDSFSFFNANIDELDDLEAAEIVRVNPTDNKVLPPNDSFISDKALIKEINEHVMKKFQHNAVFVGCARSESAKGIVYIDKKFADSFVDHILGFQLKAEVK